jgi:predicted PurR-regulated permease PerM
VPDRDRSAESPARGSGRRPPDDGLSPMARHERRRTVHRGLLAAAGALVPVLLVLLVWKSAQAFLLLFTGLLVAVLLRAAAEAVAGRSRLSYRWALAVVVLLLVGLAAVTGVLLAPRIDQQVEGLSRQLPQAVDQLMDRLEGYQWVQWIEARVRQAGEDGGGASWMGRALGVFSTLFGAAAGLVIILFTGLYLAASPRLYERGLLSLAPRRHRPRISRVMSDVDHTLRWWLVGQLTEMLIIGVLTWIGLAALGIPLAFALALIAALLTFIPNFGPIASTIPPALLALAQEPIKALWVVLLFLAIQTVESYFITPYVQKKAIEMPPVVILLSQIVLSLLFGFLGLLVATPLAAAVIVVVKRLYVEDVLGGAEELGDGEAPG